MIEELVVEVVMDFVGIFSGCRVVVSGGDDGIFGCCIVIGGDVGIIGIYDSYRVFSGICNIAGGCRVVVGGGNVGIFGCCRVDGGAVGIVGISDG